MQHRPERVASIVQRIIGEAITSRLSDPRISHLASVTRVQVSGDLAHADVYVSVMGEASQAATTLRGLESARGRIQSMLAEALAIRQVPILRFHLDESIKRGDETLRLIEKSTAEAVDRAVQKAGESAERAGEKAGEAVDKALQKTGESAEKASDDTAR
jgi:ribosome-binding factor A